jgi:hypothetical protein
VSRDPVACPQHLGLVTAAMGAEPTDESLERYAAEVPACPDCRRVLALRLGVHPGRLAVPALRLDEQRGMAELSSVLFPVGDRGTVLQRLRGRPAAVAGAALCAAALLVFLARPIEDRAPAPGVAVPTGRPPEPAPLSAPAPSAVPVAPARLGSDVAPSAPAPLGSVRPVRTTGIVALREPDAPPEVATASLPPFEDLRRGALKGGRGAQPSLQLVVIGPEVVHVGEWVLFTVVAGSPTAVSLCVSGPERGMVWRGAIDAGSTPLTSQGAAQGFGFTGRGSYQFALSADSESCGTPVHSVTVEVQ